MQKNPAYSTRTPEGIEKVDSNESMLHILLDALEKAEVHKPYKASDPIPTRLLHPFQPTKNPPPQGEKPLPTTEMIRMLSDALEKAEVHKPYKPSDPIPTRLLHPHGSFFSPPPKASETLEPIEDCKNI